MKSRLALYGLLLVAIPAGLAANGQQAKSPRNYSTPQWQAYWRQLREYEAKRPLLQARAKKIFDAEMARAKAGDCTGPASTYDTDVCYEKQVGITDQNLKQYEKIIRELISSAPDTPGGPRRGPSGPSLTSAQSTDEFDNMERVWYQYRTVACRAARAEVAGGTAAPMYQMQCRIDLDRSHMRELDSIYWLELHK